MGAATTHLTLAGVSTVVEGVIPPNHAHQSVDELKGQPRSGPEGSRTGAPCALLWCASMGNHPHALEPPRYVPSVKKKLHTSTHSAT